jgi:hypothetical protein
MNWQYLVARTANSTMHYWYNTLAYKDSLLGYSKTTNLPMLTDDFDVTYEEFTLYPEFARVHYYFMTETDLSFEKFTSMFGDLKFINAYEGLLQVVNEDGYVAIKLISTNLI